MQRIVQYRLQSFRRVQTYLAENGPELSGSTSNSPVYQKQRTMLDEAVEHLEAQAVAQDSSRMDGRGSAATISRLRHVLREEHMRPIAETARALDITVPDIGKLYLPKERGKVEALITAANSMAEAAAPYTQLFVDHGQPADFVKQLTDAADALKQAVNARGRALDRGKGAVEAMETDMVRARQAVRLIQAVIWPVILKDSKLLGEWLSARRIGARQSRRKLQPVSSSTPAQGSTTPAAGTTPAASMAPEPAQVTTSAA